MNSLKSTVGADIGRTLFLRVVGATSATWPHLEITTPHGIFHLVTVTEVTRQVVKDGALVRIVFKGKPPMGRTETFVWPPEGTEASPFGVTELAMYAPHTP